MRCEQRDELGALGIARLRSSACVGACRNLLVSARERVEHLLGRRAAGQQLARALELGGAQLVVWPRSAVIVGTTRAASASA